MDQSSGSTRTLDYLDFELEIREGDPQEYSIAVRSPAGEAQAAMRFPFDKEELKDRLQALEIALLRSSGKRRRISAEEQTVQDFGQRLFESLLVSDVRARYLMSLDEANQQDEGLRIKLRIQPPQLAVLPWEFLYDPDRGDYLCLSSDTPVVRYMDLGQPIKRLTVAPPLRILGLVASPHGLDPLDVEHEKELVEEAMKGLLANGVVELEWLEGQSWRDLQRAMRRRGPWHVFHFVGHGDFDPATEEGVIALTDEETGRAHLLESRYLARLLTEDRNLRLVFLNSCEGARGSEGDPFSGTAAALVRRGIPAVMAMQYEITDEAAIEFSRSFYEAVADGWPVDAAVAAARVAVSIRSRLEWGTPVLYMRSTDGRLFDIPKATRRKPPPGEDVMVPDVTGLNRLQASNTLIGAGLNLGNQIEAPSGDVREGRIIEQHPAARTQVMPGGFVNITVSSGPRETTSPGSEKVRPWWVEPWWGRGRALLGIMCALVVAYEATTFLLFQDWSLTGRVSDLNEEKPILVSAIGILGVLFGYWTKRTISRTRGIALMIVNSTCLCLMIGAYLLITSPAPDLEGRTVEQAVKELKGTDFKIDTVWVEASEQPKGTILDQRFPPPNKRTADFDVQLDVSVGQGKVEVPDVVGLSDREAISELIDSGFYVYPTTVNQQGELVYDRDGDVNYGNDKVIQTYPVGGTKVSVGSEVETFTSYSDLQTFIKGQCTAPIPNPSHLNGIELLRDGYCEVY